MTDQELKTGELKIGELVGYHGLKGDAKVHPADDPPDWLGTLKQVTLIRAGKRIQLTITNAAMHGRMVLLRFEGYPDRTALEALGRGSLMACVSDLPALDAGDYRVDDLLGLVVTDVDTGERKGVVHDVISSPGKDYLEIRSDKSGQLMIVPFEEAFIGKVDLSAKTMELHKLGDFLDEAPAPKAPGFKKPKSKKRHSREKTSEAQKMKEQTSGSQETTS